MILSQIFIYPVKSLRGIALEQVHLEARGPAFDRRWMVVSPTGEFFTQRECPEMALIHTALTARHLELEHLHKPLGKVQIPLQPPPDSLPQRVQIWDDACLALRVSRDADAWLSEALERPCHLVYMPDDTQRPTDPFYSRPEDIVSFADGFPYLIIGQASLDELNTRLEVPIIMQRFRPNFVFTGGTPFEEDTWSHFSIGNQSFRGVKTCARCQLTMIDPDTAQMGKEPLRTLSQYRRVGHRILFGMNACWDAHHSDAPIIRVGDPVSPKSEIMSS